MRTSNHKGLRGLVAAVLLLAGAAHPAMATDGRAPPAFASADAAYRHALSSWRGGFVELAIPAFRFAADRGNFLAKFYLARIFADSGTPYMDHAAAYKLYLDIANNYTRVDPDDDRRAPFVAKSLTALARYVKDGLADINLKADPARAAELLRHAAQYFNDEDAQFELGKLYLKGEGVSKDPVAAMHWLTVATTHGHAAAQAFLADIFWRGLEWRDAEGRMNRIKPDPLRAFALINVAVEHAPESDRIWIEDVYQNIYCGASSGTRLQAQGVVADWRRKYGRNLPPPQLGLGALPPRADRACSNGEQVPSPLVRQQPKVQQPSVIQGGMMGVGITTTEDAR
ncbi:MAG: tetratricopeptide repeat protein [Hyphomicrobiaceae bacterium]